MLAQVVKAATDDLRVYHHSGMWNRRTIAAFGCLEALVHTGDVASGLAVPYDPPPEVCARVVAHLFRGAPSGDPWHILWWATGRGDLEGKRHLGSGWMSYWMQSLRREGDISH